MKKILAVAVLCISLSGYSQYNTAIGLRVGETSGLTVRHFVSDGVAIEGMLGIWNRGVSGTLLYEFYRSAFGAQGLNWYYGAGGHLAVVTHRDGYNWYDYGQRRYYYREGSLGLGIDGIVGLEYKIPRAPIAFSFDLKPFLEFNLTGGAFVALDPGLGIKVAF